ncbi:MAG: class I SAM-dependent methyltransferase [Gammaproteobacteria bacterium]
MATLSEKWDQIYREADALQIGPAEVLSENAFLLPQSGAALDLACGLGGSARFLAQLGFTSHAWDVSVVAIAKLEAIAENQSLNILTRCASIGENSFSDEQFDVIVVARFLNRRLCNAIMRSLKPGGLLFYQTYTVSRVSDTGPSSPDYLLKQGELLNLFQPLRLIYYRDNGLTGDVNSGLRNEAQFIGQKRSESVKHL